MKNKIALLLTLSLLTACQTAPKPEPIPVDEVLTPTEGQLQDMLGMRREADDLGFAEKRFNSCLKSGGAPCRDQFFTVVHFQLLCRDSEGTVSNVPVALTPLQSNRVQWKLGPQNGNTRTDGQGFGQFNMVSERSTRGQRLTLRIGKQFLGFTASDLTKVVLPKNFCI